MTAHTGFNFLLSIAKIGGGYFLKLNPENYYEQMFTDSDMITESRETDGTDAVNSIFGDNYGGLNQARPCKPEDVCVSIQLTLLEVYNGAIKRIEYCVDQIKADGKTTEQKQVSKEIEIRPGCDSDCIVLKGCGNQAAGQTTSDVKVKIEVCEHPDYKRIGNDLLFTKKITLLEALSQTPCTF